MNVADDVVLINKNPNEANRMMKKLVEACEWFGLQINLAKTTPRTIPAVARYYY